jgi:hypothetical protein
VIPPIQCTVQSISVLDGFPQVSRVEPQRQVTEEQIDKSGAQTYFDGACQGDPPLCGSGGVIYLNEHVISFKAGLCRGANNLAELMALKLLPILSAEKGAQKLQIFGDLKLDE